MSSQPRGGVILMPKRDSRGRFVKTGRKTKAKKSTRRRKRR